MSTAVIFSIDPKDMYETMKFYRHACDLKAGGKMLGKIIPCLSMYEGELEQSFLVKEADFFRHFFQSQYCMNQDTFMTVSTSGKHQIARIEDWYTEEVLTKGRLEEVTMKKAFKSKGFTYRPDMNAYWILREKE